MSFSFPTVRRKSTATKRIQRSPSHGSSTDGSQEWTSGRHAFVADKRLNRERSRSTERLSTLSNISEQDIPEYSKLQDPLQQPQTSTIKTNEIISAKKHE